MTRQQMIDEIVEHELEINFSDRSYVRELIMTGFKGLDSKTDDEIKQEWEEIQ